MSKPKSGPQDLPPKGGYAPFNIERIKLRNIFGGRLGAALLITTNLIGWPIYFRNWVNVRKESIEHMSAQVATFPILYAERDRTMLKHMKRLRDMETDLMKDFPYWEVGTFFGVPKYETLPEDRYVDPASIECYVGVHPLDQPFMMVAQLYL